MPQVKIKQGNKSSINNNAGVLNAGTLAITTDSNELFVTHNDGTVHQLCDNVNKSGDTMTGNLNMSGNSFERAGFEVVTSLPTTNNFVGRQVTYQGRSYIWDGSAWKCDSDYLEIGGRNLIRNFGNWNRLGGFTYDPQDESININNTPNYFDYSESNSLYLLDNTMYTLVVEVPNIVGVCYIELQSRPDAVGNNSIVATYLIQGINKFTFNSGILPVGFTHYTLRFYGNDQSSPITVKIKNIKLEKGNVATDWTPAPEDKANENQTINFDTNNIEPTQTGTTTKTSTWLWQYLTQSVNYSWLKLKTWVGGLFSAGSATTNNNYLPKIDDVNKKLVKSNIFDNGTTPKYGANTIWHSGNDGPGSGLDADLLDGKHANEFITPADFETNQLYTPTLIPIWSILRSNNSPSGVSRTSSAITLEYGYKPSATVRAKWTQPSGYDTPESCDGLCGSNLPAIDTPTNPAANLSYDTYFDPISPITPSKSVTVWTIYANKKGITVSGNKLIMPEGEVSANALLSVIYKLPIYYGVVTVNSLDEAKIKALPSSMKDCSTGSKTFSPTINALDTQYWVYAYPSAWGVLTNISNADGDWTAAFATGLIDIESSNTLLTTQYRYYITVNKGAFKTKTINFS